MQKDRFFSYLGMATRAGRSVSGEFCVERSVKRHRAKLVIVSEEASGNSRKKLQNMCAYYKVPFCVLGSSEELGKAMGKAFRMSAAIEDEGLAKAAIQQLKQESGIGGGEDVE